MATFKNGIVTKSMYIIKTIAEFLFKKKLNYPISKKSLYSNIPPTTATKNYTLVQNIHLNMIIMTKDCTTNQFSNCSRTCGTSAAFNNLKNETKPQECDFLYCYKVRVVMSNTCFMLGQ